MGTCRVDTWVDHSTNKTRGSLSQSSSCLLPPRLGTAAPVLPALLLTAFLFCRIIRAFVRTFKYFFGLRFEVKGLENFKVEGPAIIVSNHQSILDMMGEQLVGGKRTFPLLTTERSPACPGRAAPGAASLSGLVVGRVSRHSEQSLGLLSLSCWPSTCVNGPAGLSGAASGGSCCHLQPPCPTDSAECPASCSQEPAEKQGTSLSLYPCPCPDCWVLPSAIPPGLMEVLPDNCVQVGKKELMYMGSVGLIIYLGGVIFINRKSTSSAKMVMSEVAKTMVAENVSVTVGIVALLVLAHPQCSHLQLLAELAGVSQRCKWVSGAEPCLSSGR